MPPRSSTRPTSADRSRSHPAASSAARGPLWAALCIAVAGVALSILLTRIHAQAHAGISSFCSISDTVNCDRVATSRYSVVLGLPVALWGILGYSVAAALAAWGLRRRERSSAAAGLLVLVSAVAVVVSVALALVSELAIGALCLLCAGSWLLSGALLVAAARACRGGAATSIRAGLGTLRARPVRAASLALAGGAALAVAATAYPRYWEQPQSPQRPAPLTTPAAASTTAAGAGVGGVETGAAAPRGGTVVVEYSDYECPFCAKAHEETRAILKRRPDIVIVHRQFPLDASCNPAVTRTIHPRACELARAGVCALDQGRSEEMDDALFRNQRAGLSPLELAKRVGLDPDRFQACMASPAASRRVEADIAAGIGDHVRATPTYVVNGVAKAGELPLELLPPQPATAR